MDPNKNSNLKKYIKKNKQLIKKLYTIVDHEADGCDEFGITYWVECKNGETYRDWEVNSIIKKEIDKLYNEVSNGFEYNDTTYYFNTQQLKILFDSL
tara:strand:- start:628 stop:918 length:291 start_codon:yes stop_codon:yes gene_type:complete